MTWSTDDLLRRLDEHVRTYGDWVVWETGLPCACRAAGALRMSAGCARCEGEGFVWVAPRQLKGILMPAHADRRLATMGWVNPADLLFAPAPSEPIADFDRITLLSPLPVEPEVITRGQAARDGAPGLAPTEDRLAYQAVNVLHCALDETPERQLVQGDAFICAGRTLRWLKPPPDGSVYVIKYEALTEWVAFASPFEVLDRGRSLGRRVLLRKRHLVNLREQPQRDVRSLLGC